MGPEVALPVNPQALLTVIAGKSAGQSADDLGGLGPSGSWLGRFCCLMYWRSTEIGAPPTDPAKYEPDHSRFALQ